MSTLKKCNFEQIEVGDRLAEVQYYEVIKKGENQITVRNERGYPIDVSSDVVEEGMFSASQFNEVRKVTRTQLCEILEGAGDAIFTVQFHKKIKEKDVSTAILEVLESAEAEDHKAMVKQLRGVVKQAIAGETRVLVGYLIQTEPKMGRSEVIDLEAQGEHRIRLVDHRTLEWIILKNVKYELK